MNRGRLLATALLSGAAAMLPSCATVISGTTQSIPITSTPAGASVTVEPGGMRLTTPGSVVLPRNGPGYRVRFAADGYYSYEARIRSTKDDPSLFSLQGPFWFVDALTGADRTLFPKELHADLLKK